MLNLETLKNIPKLPGCYKYFDCDGNIIYIGKSVNLHSRVNSYFNGKSKLNFAKQKMVSQIEKIETVVTNTGIESLLLETTLIKKHKPKYNILMKDDKSHTYIKITNDIFPKVIKTRSSPLAPLLKREGNIVGNDCIVPNNNTISNNKNSGIYFGPYISTNYVNNIIKLTKKVFGHRSCNIIFEKTYVPFIEKTPIPNPSPFKEEENEKNHPSPGRGGIEGGVKIKSTNGSKIPCIDYHIKRCSGPCLLTLESIKKYREDIENIKDFLSGNFDKVIEDLTIKMKNYANNLMFEEAQKIKIDLDSINSLKQNQIVTDILFENCDVINFLEKYDKYYISKIEVRNHKISGIYNFEIQNKLQDLNESIIYFIENNYIENTKNLDLILPIDLEIEKDILKELFLKIQVPKIGEKTNLLDLAYKNAFEFAYKTHLESLSTKGFTKKDMSDLLNILGYKQINKDIVFECNDISHISGNHTVASRSVIENGKTNNSKYRKLKIKTLRAGEINDFDSMREVMTRRIAEIQKTGYIPDLIIIDGGKGQLSSVMEVVENTPILAFPLQGERNNNHPSPSGEGTGVRTSEEMVVRISEDLLNNLQIVSLAKREEELFLPGEKESIIIDKESNILRMIQKIRDEAHRFAITFNRDSRIKASKKNILEELPGIGPKTRAKLLKNYGSVDNIVLDEELPKILNKTQIETLQNHGLI